MNYVAAGLVLGAFTTIASADPAEYYGHAWERPSEAGVFLDVGGGWMRARPDGMTYRAEYLRFAPQLAIKHWFYVGAAFEVGRIYSSSGKLNGMLPAVCSVGSGPECSGGNNLIDESSGTIAEPQVFLGVRDLIGIVSGGFEIAPTERRTTASTNYLNQSFTTYVTTIELHARLDVWATPHVSAGITLGSDFNSVHDLQAGLQIGFHFEPYDTMVR